MRPWALIGDPFPVAFWTAFYRLQAARSQASECGKILKNLATRGLNVPTRDSKLTYSMWEKRKAETKTLESRLQAESVTG